MHVYVCVCICAHNGEEHLQMVLYDTEVCFLALSHVALSNKLWPMSFQAADRDGSNTYVHMVFFTFVLNQPLASVNWV